MADVKWIKITTNMFDDEKIDFISSLPEGHSIFYIWIRLLTMAGRCNAGGYIFLTEKIPYTDDNLASRFKMNLNVVRLALETLSRLEMIDIDNRGIRLVNWDKYQNVDRLDKLREYDRDRKRMKRNETKQIPSECPADNNRTSTDIPPENTLYLNLNTLTLNLTDKEEGVVGGEGKAEPPKDNPRKVKFAEFVSMTNDEYSSLVAKLGEHGAKRCIEILDNYKGANGKRYKSDYRAILNWVVGRYNEERKQSIAQPKSVVDMVEEAKRRMDCGTQQSGGDHYTTPGGIPIGQNYT